MKRDLDFLRVLLLSYAGRSIEYEMPDKAAYQYYQQLLFSAGYKMRYYDSTDEPAFALSHQGWEVADLIADDDLWNKAKEIVAESRLEAVPFEMMLEIIKGETGQVLKDSVKTLAIKKKVRELISQGCKCYEWPDGGSFSRVYGACPLHSKSTILNL